VTDVAFFIEVNGLSELEDQEKWEEARALLYGLWDADRENLDLFLRLFSECWYVLYKWGCIMDKDPSESPSYRAFRDNLIECAAYGLTHFNKDTRFLWMAGYMIVMYPFVFYDVKNDKPKSSTLFLEWESKGQDMLDLSYKQNPNDLMAKFARLHYCSRPISAEISAADEAKEYRGVNRNFGDYFTGSTAVERYFKKQWTGQLNTVSNYVQFHEILAEYPSIKILDHSAAQDILDRVTSKYHVDNLHYFWSKNDAPIVKRTKIRDLPAYYGKTLPTQLSGNTYLIIDCCDDRFIVCHGHLNSLIEMLKVYDYEMIEIYLLNNALHIRFCVNHVSEVFEFE
jgi:hypothetical protein